MATNRLEEQGRPQGERKRELALKDLSLEPPQNLKRRLTRRTSPAPLHVRVAWMDSYARFLQESGVSPLGRVLLAQIVQRELFTPRVKAGPKSRTPLSKMVSNFLSKIDGDLGSSRARFLSICRSGQAHLQTLEVLSRALGFKNASDSREFLEFAVGADTLELAVKGIMEQRAEAGRPRQGLFQFGRFIRELKSRPDLSAASGADPSHQLSELISKALGDEITSKDTEYGLERWSRILAGATYEEILGAWVDAYENDVFLRLKYGGQRWISDSAILTKPLESRLVDLARGLIRGELVLVEDLVRMWPEAKGVIEAIDNKLHPSTAWYVASTLYYSYPDEALKEIFRALQSHKRPRGTPRSFLERHEQWISKRAGRAKLNSGSMALFFGSGLD